MEVSPCGTGIEPLAGRDPLFGNNKNKIYSLGMEVRVYKDLDVM
jgi:hypothetical protein